MAKFLSALLHLFLALHTWDIPIHLGRYYILEDIPISSETEFKTCFQ